jgi:hypothetical protein
MGQDIPRFVDHPTVVMRGTIVTEEVVLRDNCIKRSTPCLHNTIGYHNFGQPVVRTVTQCNKIVTQCHIRRRQAPLGMQ